MISILGYKHEFPSTAVKFGCPVQWESVTCYAVVPGAWGHDVDDPTPQVEVAEMPRLRGAFMLKDVWDLVDHSGTIPDDEERAAADTYFAHMGNELRYSLERLLPHERTLGRGRVKRGICRG